MLTPDLDPVRRLGELLGPPAAAPPDELRRRVLDGAAPVRPAAYRPVRLRRAALAGAALAALVAVAAVVTPSGGGKRPGAVQFSPAGPAVDRAVDVLRLASKHAALAPVVRPRPDQFLFTESIVEVQNVPLDHRPAQTLPIRVVREWRSVDGTRSGLSQWRRRDAPDGAWTSTWNPGCRHGRPTFLDGPNADRTCTPSPISDDSLPTDSEAMHRYLYRPPADDDGAVAAQRSPDDLAFSRVGELLGEGRATPAVQRALFAAAARIPGVTVRSGVTDLVGRPGVALVRAGTDVTVEILLGAVNYEYLGMTFRLGDAVADHEHLIVQIHSRTALRRVAFVDHARDLP
ncbi:CU044_5270 family protein [Actinoplanes sp. NPDC049548]|uniref:CU044_5270 family protein n=1 Tax=Actinoplanes sp. NPDC049548 TaxID=3155152 RepID=UPI0034133BC7